MRKYVFTEAERRRLKVWLETGAEDNETKKLFTRVRRNLNPIKRDIELLSKTSAKLRLDTNGQMTRMYSYPSYLLPQHWPFIQSMLKLYPRGF